MIRLLHLLKAEVLRGEFTLSSGKKSDWYINCRKVTLTPLGSRRAAEALYSKLPKETTAVVGPVLAACPLVTSIGMLAAMDTWLSLKLGYVRSIAKDHGTKSLIEGCELDATDKVVVVDDVATSGGSLLRACEAVNKTGAKVMFCLVLVDREEGATAKLDGISLVALYTKKDLCDENDKIQG